MMNGRSMPIGQVIPSDAGRRRPYHQHQHLNQQYSQQSIYPQSTFVQNYGAGYYPIVSQYHNSQPQYPPFSRHPAIPPYVAPLLPQQQLPYSRPHHSPAATSTYRLPPPSSPNPLSSRSLNTFRASQSPNTSRTTLNLSTPSTVETPKVKPFRVPLPWFSDPDSNWPTKRSKKKRKSAQKNTVSDLKLPITTKETNYKQQSTETLIESNSKIITTQSEIQSKIQQPFESNLTNSSCLSKSNLEKECGPSVDVKLISKPPHRPSPITPALPKSTPHEITKSVRENSEEKSLVHEVECSSNALELIAQPENHSDDANSTGVFLKSSPPVVKQAWTTPKLWAGIFKPINTSSIKSTGKLDQVSVNSNTEVKAIKPLAEALRFFNVNSNEHKVKFLEPRGLVNTGNMCYMNSILQVLVFCSPFFNFLDQMSNGAVSSFKNETPLLDALILVMREYSVIDTASSVEQLRLRLQESELKRFGEPFTPDFFYNVVNQLPRFSSMRRGHQQDAEEFLGFLLEGLHDECIQVMQSTSGNTTLTTPGVNINTNIIPPSGKPDSAKQIRSSGEQAWFEVGPKQKTVETRSSGPITVGSPITKIFGGNLRSELRVPGLKASVTLEPYQPLQLDIGAPNVQSILDALKGLTRSESLNGDFKSPRGPNFIATKQVFIETLPSVLILHLKRFQYDNTGGTQKIWKKIEYPLVLELPTEIFARQKRAEFSKNGPPKYQLISVVYHHGKNASGGHYTVDVRRQDGNDWIRIDDTFIRRVGSEEVAGLENQEDLKNPGSNFNIRKEIPVRGRGSLNVEFSDKDTEEDGWKQANGSGKKWSSIVNGSSASKEKGEKHSIKDNKVAYILFYQKI